MAYYSVLFYYQNDYCIERGWNNMYCVYCFRSSIPEMNTTSALTALKKNHSVIFLIVYDEEIDRDWHGIFMRQARDKILKAKFAFTTKPEIVEVYNIYFYQTCFCFSTRTCFSIYRLVCSAPVRCDM